MSDTTRALLLSWEWRTSIVLICGFFAVAYSLGWWRLRRIRGGNSAKVATVWRLVSYWAGWLILFLALVSPIEVLSGQLFTFHMIQHLMIAMFAPPLLWLGEPLPIVMWGLPLRVRLWFGRNLFAKHAPARPYLQSVTQPFVLWGLFFLFLWGWHDANLYNLTLRQGWVHDLEHATFFYSAMGLWWHITGAGPRLHKRFSYMARIGFALACVPANMIAGVAIAMANTVIYTYYETVPFSTFNMDVLTDQKLGGAIMWVPGSMMYVIAVVVLITVWLNEQEKQQRARTAR